MDLYTPKVIDLEGQVTEHFRWKEALFLRDWGWSVYPDKVTAHNIVKTCIKLEEIRQIINAPIYILSFLRPRQYNKAIGGATSSYHIQGLAADWYSPDRKCSDLRNFLKSYLEPLQIRMEKLPDDKNWVHIDLGSPVGGNRIFRP